MELTDLQVQQTTTWGTIGFHVAGELVTVLRGGRPEREYKRHLLLAACHQAAASHWKAQLPEGAVLRKEDLDDGRQELRWWCCE